jgi:hypothetical protein
MKKNMITGFMAIILLISALNLNAGSNCSITSNSADYDSQKVYNDKISTVYNEVWVDDDWSGSKSGQELAKGRFFGFNAFDNIQDAINKVSEKGIVNVLPGTYSKEQAKGFNPITGKTGSHNFNIFINKSITLRGVDASGNPIENRNKIAATIVAKRNLPIFGSDAIFVQADNVTITGLDINGFTSDNNKTIEVIGDNFTIKNCNIHGLNGAACICLNDFRYNPATNVSHVDSFTIESNWIDGGGNDATGICITNGVAMSPDVSKRSIKNNRFFDVSEHIAIIASNGNPGFTNPNITESKNENGKAINNLDLNDIIANNYFDKPANILAPADDDSKK